MHQLKTQWTWIWQYICLRPTYQHLDDFGFFSSFILPPQRWICNCRGIKSVRRILAVAGDSILHQGLLQSDGPGIRGWNGNWDSATLLPQTWAKGAQVLLLQKTLESGFEMVWMLEGRGGNFCSALSHAFVIQKVECGSTPNTDAGPCLPHPPTQMRFILSVPYQDTEEGHLSLPMYAEVAKKASPGFEDHRPQLLGRG